MKEATKKAGRRENLYGLTLVVFRVLREALKFLEEIGLINMFLEDKGITNTEENIISKILGF